VTQSGPLDRFIAAIAQLVPDFQNNDDKLGLAISGGPDSLALLLLAHDAFPGRIMAATVDHDLRPEARAEAEFVSAQCAKRGIEHQILMPTIPIRGSIQTVARQARYSLLQNWMKQENIAWLATAHHADDQLETMLMRILRGSGVDGMSGIRARRGNIIRPLLHFPKKLLANFVIEHGITAIDDPSNHDQSFDRVRVRKALSQLEGFDVTLASQSASAINHSRVAINWMVDGLGSRHIRSSETGCALDCADFPHEIVRRLLLKCLHICDPALSPRGEQIERIITALQHGETITIGNILCKGGSKWTFAPAPKRQNK